MSTKRLFAVVFCLLFFISSIFAQSDDWFYGKKIKKITFEGLKSLSSTDLESVTNPYVGMEFSDDVYIEVLSKLFSLDYFENVSPSVLPYDSDYSACILKFSVEERPIVSSLKFSGNKKIPANDLRDAITLAKGDIYVSSTVILDERRIRELYLQKGYTAVRVSSEVTETENGMDVVFVITEGRPAIVSSLQFRGNNVVTSKTLKGLLGLKENGIFQKGIFQEAVLEADRQAIIGYYQDRGYVDVAINDVVREVYYNQEKDQDELTLIFDITEGTQFTYGGIVISGNTIFSTEELLALVTLKEGSVFNQTKFAESFQKICDLYYNNGYTSNQFYPNLVRDAENQSIVCQLMIYEFPKSHIENIIVKGNEKTKDYVITREIPIESGDIFSKTKLEDGLRNLYNTQFFSAILPEFVSGSEQNLVDLVLTVEEGNTTSIEFGVTFTGIENPNESPISGFVKWADTNVGGTGKTISTSLLVSNTEQTVSLGYSDSWFLGMPLSISASLDFSHSNEICLQKVFLPTGINETSYYMDYEQYSFGANFSAGKRWNPNFGILTLTGGVGSNLIYNKYDSSIYTPVSSIIADNNNSIGINNSVWGSISIDDRDIYYDPSKGWFASQQVSLTGLIPNVESEYYLRTDTKAEFYVPLFEKPMTPSWTFKLVLAGYSGLSFVFPTFSDKIEEGGYLFIDGMFNGRGWGNIEMYQKRGNAMWSSNLELRMPITSGIFAFDFFGDAVVIKDTPLELFTNTTLDDFYFSFGPGMRFSLPQFPLRLLLANTFKFEDNNFVWDKKWQFVLSFTVSNR